MAGYKCSGRIELWNATRGHRFIYVDAMNEWHVRVDVMYGHDHYCCYHHCVYLACARIDRLCTIASTHVYADILGRHVTSSA
jgi:hypothetical protein